MRRYLQIFSLLILACLAAQAQYNCSSPGIICLPNDTTTAPVVNKLAKLSTAGLATVAGTTDTQGFVGVCLQNCALGGTGVFGYYGPFPLVVDASTTLQHWIIPSSSVAGDGSDTGSATYPSTANGTVVGQVVQASTGAASKSLVQLVLRQPQPTITVASGTSALGTGAISSATCATVVTTAATGVASTDSIIWNANGSIKAVTGYVAATTGGLTIAAYPTSGNVNFDVCNWSSGSLTPGAVTINWRVVR